MVLAALLSLTAVPALGSDDLTTFYRSPYASVARNDNATGARSAGDAFYRSPWAVMLSPAVPAQVGGTLDGAASTRACACQHS